jgi:hypothetical protein
MLHLKNIVINWQISNLQQKIRQLQRKGLDVKTIRSQIAELNRKKIH